jgi:hypothetical protein
MNLNNILIIFFLFASSNLFAQECKAKVNINTDLPSSRICINDTFIAKGNALIQLGNGKYYLVVMENSGRWDAKSLSGTLIINNCKDTTLSFSFNSRVYLNTEPQDAYVYRDSELVGHTPLFIPVGSEEIVLKKPGYEEKLLNIYDIKSDQKIMLNFTGETKGENFFKKNIFKILVGGIVALGGVTAYFKLKADNNFDKYQSSGDKYYLDQTHKYDLVSGITFGAVQVGFGFLIYYFLSD